MILILLHPKDITNLREVFHKVHKSSWVPYKRSNILNELFTRHEKLTQLKYIDLIKPTK